MSDIIVMLLQLSWFIIISLTLGIYVFKFVIKRIKK